MSKSENRFLCPHCRQKLACEDGYAGWQIQCPACQGPVIVPLPVTASPAASAFWGPPPLPTRTSDTTTAQTSALGKWQERGILVGAAILFGVAFMVWLVSWRYGVWPSSPSVLAFEIQLWFAVGVMAFSFGVAYAAEFTNSLVARVAAGCIIPVLVTGFCWSALGMLVGGCSTGCGNAAERAAGPHAMFVSFLWFGGTAFLWAVLYGWLYALNRR